MDTLAGLLSEDTSGSKQRENYMGAGHLDQRGLQKQSRWVAFMPHTLAPV